MSKSKHKRYVTLKDGYHEFTGRMFTDKDYVIIEANDFFDSVETIMRYLSELPEVPEDIKALAVRARCAAKGCKHSSLRRLAGASVLLWFKHDAPWGAVANTVSNALMAWSRMTMAIYKMPHGPPLPAPNQAATPNEDPPGTNG